MSEDEKEAIYEIEDIRFDERTNRKIEIILNLINKLQKEIDKKDKVIDLMYQDIENEYMGTSYMEYYSLENYYRRAEEEE